MKPANITNMPARAAAENDKVDVRSLHPLWKAFIDLCVDLRHGEIEILKIQDGVPVFAEVVKKKVKFGS